MNTPKAIIFDLDGILTDTSEYHYQAWKHLTDDEGIGVCGAMEQESGLSKSGKRE